MAFLPDGPTGGSLSYGMPPDFPGTPPIALDDAEAGALVSNPQPSNEAAFEEARQNLAAEIGVKALKERLDKASHLDDLNEATRNYTEGLAENAKSLFTDPAQGRLWAEARGLEARGLIDAATAKLTLQRRAADADAWVAQLGETALRTGGQDAADLIAAGTAFIHRAQAAGIYDEATARARRQNWLQTHIEARLKQLSPVERIAALGEVPPEDTIGQAQGGSERAFSLTSVLPPEERVRLKKEARVELDRNTALQTWQKADQYEQSMAEVSRGEPKPPPWRAAIEADPDLDDLTRTRLLKQHDAMQRKLDAFWLAKAEYDKPNGRKFSVDNAEDRDFVEQIYTRLGGDAAALHAVASRTGMMPDTALEAMNGRLNSKEPASVLQAIKELGRLKHNFPMLLLLGGNETWRLQNVLTEFRYYSQGRPPDQAAKQFIYARSPEGAAERIAKLKNTDINAVIARTTSMSGLERVLGGNPAVTKAVIAEYRDLLRERLVATGDPDLARKQANDQMKPLLDAAAEDLAEKDAAGRPSWIERAWLNGLDGFYRHTATGAGQLAKLADMARAVEADPNAREHLLNRFFPGLKNSKWEENREVRWQEIKSAPERYRKILADLKRYDEMKGFNSASEFGAAAAGQIVASLLSPESYVGWSVKGASWSVRAMKAALQQAGIAGAADLGVQWNLVRAGVQDKIDLWQTGGAAFGGAVVGSAVGAVTPPAGNAKSGHVGITPEGPQRQPAPDVKVNEPALDVSSSEAQTLAAQDVPATLQVQGQAELRAAEPAKRLAAATDQAALQNQALKAGTNEVQPDVSEPGWPRIKPDRLDASTGYDVQVQKLWTNEEAAAPLALRLAKIEELISKNPVSEKYIKAEVGESGRKNYPDSFFAVHGEELRGKVEVHRAVEDCIHSWYPDLFTWGEINSFANLRGIPMDGIGSALHRSAIRTEWNSFYLAIELANKRPSREEVLSYATKIDRKYGALFIPPL